jgi:hypothetical protein
MTGRPPLAPGEHGQISFKNLKDGKVRARVLLRDVDGVIRDLVATASTRGAADRKLQARLKARTVPSAMGITAKMRVSELCDYFLQQRLKQTFTTAPPKEKKKSGRRKGKAMPLKPRTLWRLHRADALGSFADLPLGRSARSSHRQPDGNGRTDGTRRARGRST